MHAGPGHFLPNLAVIAYAGYRVERALGATAFLVVSAASVACGGLLVALFSAFSVMGSSILGYGFLGALLAIGFRFGETIPARHRRFYGYGNLLLFAMLFVSGLRMEQASHLGHMGGLIGGILATVLIKPAICFRQPERNRRRRFNLTLTILLSLLPLFWMPIVERLPGVALGGVERVEREDMGVSFELPSRLMALQGHLRGLPAWALNAQSEEGVFCGLETLPKGEVLQGEPLASFWSQGGNFPIREEAPPDSLGPGWTAQAFELEDDSGNQYRIVEHQLQRGRWVVRAGYRIQSGPSGPSRFREAFFASFLDTLEVSEPPDLRTASQAWLLKKDTANALAYAEQLRRIEDIEGLDEVLRVAAEKQAPRQRKALGRWKRIRRQRIAFWGEYLEFNRPEHLSFVMDVLRSSPRDTASQREGILWLGSNGHCDDAHLAYDEFVALRETAARASGISDALGTICPTP